MKINHDIIRKNSLIRNMKRWGNQRNILGYLWNRVEWFYYPRFFILKEYPIHVDIELSSYCQLDCPMCFRHHRDIEKQGNMSFDTFKKIIDEISGKVYSIKFTGRGEGLINKDFPKFMDYLKGKKFGEVSIITNGLLLSEEMLRAVVESDIDFVILSIDGLKDEYEKIRNPGKYEDIYGIVQRLHQMRKAQKRKRPMIRIQSVHVSVEDERKFLEIWEPISDEILFLFYKDYSKDAANKQIENYICPLLYQRMIIHHDGTVPMCINDEYEESVMGSVLKSSVKDIWKGDLFAKARKDHREGLRLVNYKNCSRCKLTTEGHGK